MVGLGEQAILRCKGAETVSFAPRLNGAWGFLGVLQILSGHALLHMRSKHHLACACQWRGANNGGVGRTSHSKVQRGGNCQFCSKTQWGLGVLGVLQIFSGYALLHMCSRHHVGCACPWRGANNGGDSRTNQFKV